MNIKKLFIACSLVLPILFSCSEEDNTIVGNGIKPEMDIMIYPQDGLKYGDEITISGEVTDARNLKMYSVTLKDKDGSILSQKDQMLLGTSFQMDESLFIPLPKNAKPADLSVEVLLQNSQGEIVTEMASLSSLQVPKFDNLYLILGNNSTLELTRNGDVFEGEAFFPAKIKGVISTTPTSSGLFWGMNNGEIQTMGKDSILIGSDLEASCKLTFNPETFELTFGERLSWTPLPESDCLYILGTISGHWMDGDITVEKEKMKMKGYESDNLRYYSWFPPQGDDPNVGMWGTTAAGIFRIKTGQKDSYILWDGTKLVESTTNETEKSFPLTAAGAYEIRVYFENETCTKLQVIGTTRTLEFANDNVTINGLSMTPKMEFAGKQLSLVPGTNYSYEGEMSLEKGATLTSNSLNLADFLPSADLISGGGNATWKLNSFTGTYIIRLDVFSGSFYICPVDGYPNVIYMNGWSWSHFAGDNPMVWDMNRVLPLVRTEGTTYEALFYMFNWGGSVQFYLTHPTKSEGGKPIEMPNKDFAPAFVDGGMPASFLFPISIGYHRVILDLKDGVTIGSDNTVTPKGSEPFTLNFVAQ